jgi:hypothetical protein
VRRLVTTVVIVAVSIIASFDDGDARPVAGAASRHTRSSRARTPSRSRPYASGPTSAFECDTPRGIDAFGSTGRCLRALCADANRVNAYVLDATERLRRNPCAAVDPSDAWR